LLTENSHAAVSAFLCRMDELMLIAERAKRQGINLFGLRFGFLHAKNVGTHLPQPFKQALACRRADAIEI